MTSFDRLAKLLNTSQSFSKPLFQLSNEEFEDWKYQAELYIQECEQLLHLQSFQIQSHSEGNDRHNKQGKIETDEQTPPGEQKEKQDRQTNNQLRQNHKLDVINHCTHTEFALVIEAKTLLSYEYNRRQALASTHYVTQQTNHQLQKATESNNSFKQHLTKLRLQNAHLQHTLHTVQEEAQEKIDQLSEKCQTLQNELEKTEKIKKDEVGRIHREVVQAEVEIKRVKDVMKVQMEEKERLEKLFEDMVVAHRKHVEGLEKSQRKMAKEHAAMMEEMMRTLKVSS